MKANQKFLNNDDEAVSPVIAVILMVAITVVLAATVYVWVSGFGSNSSAPAKSMSLTSAGALNKTSTPFYKSYVVASASPGMKYSDFGVAVSGTNLPQAAACSPATDDKFGACADGASGSSIRAAGDLVQAGDTITLRTANALSGATLRITDPNSNSVMLTLTIS